MCSSDLVTVTAKLAGGATMTHDLRPGRIDVIQVGRVKLDGDLGDWPKAAALVGRAFESAAGLDPGVRVGWSDEGIWLAARLPAKDLAAGDPKQFWDWTCVELFVDTSGRSAGGWGDKAHQFWLTPVRDGGTWRLYAGEWKRGEAIDATIYDDRRVRTSVRVEGESVTLEALIPAEAIGAKPQAGLLWRAAVTAHVTRPNEATAAAAWPRSKRSGLLEGASYWGQLRLVRADGSVPAGSAAAAAPGPPKPRRQFPGPERWEKHIRAFEARDKKSPPPKGEILFVGSSSIVGWNTKKWFPDLKTINRGFGGSDVSDSLHFADRIILPYRPRTIVLYAGDNDIARGKSPQRVLADYKALVAKVHAALPRTRIVFVPIKPSLARWKLVGKMREANALIRAVTEADERLGYVDIDTPMIGADGRPRGELFKKDGLHLNEAGYKLWSSLLRPHLKTPGEGGRSEAPPPGPRKPRRLVDAGPPFGRLPLVDEIDCGQAGGHEFREDPPAASRVETVLGRPCRVLPNEGGPRYFAYRIGRGCGLKAGACYVLSVDYPEDRPRTMFVLNRGAETARGLSTGGAIGDVLYTYTNNNVESLKIPLSKAHRTWKAMFTLHDRFPGIRQPRGAGSRPETPKDGFLVIFAQPKSHSAPMSAGAAVARVRLFELPDPSRHYVKLRRPPAPLPRRHVFWREEMSDGMVQSLDASQRACREPSDFFEYKARRMRFLGADVFCKDLLEFGHNQGWDAGAYGGNDWYWASKHPKRWQRILAIAARHGLSVLPYYEYCGGVGQRGLGRQKRCVSLAGKKVYTHIEWSEKANVDITDPETLADAIKLLDATIVRHKDRARFVGAWFRTRPSHMPISFSGRCLALFAKDAGADGPVTREKLKADAKLLARYYDWWFEKRKAFLVALRDHLRAQVGEEMAVLLTACGAEPGPPIHGFKKRVITDDVAGWSKLLADPAHKQVTPYAYGRTVAAAEHLAAATRMPATWGQWEWQHSLPPPDPRRYRHTPGVMMTLPFNRAYTVSEPRAFDAFRAPTGLAIARHYPLNETVMDKKLGYFVCDVERAGPFCMLAEARAVATGDPTHIGYLAAAVFTRGFPEHVRRFNAAFLALPALPSTRLPEACADSDVVVRAIETKGHGTYVAVVNGGLAARGDVTVKLPRGGKLTDAATGRAIEARDGAVTLSLGPCELRALHVQ